MVHLTTIGEGRNGRPPCMADGLHACTLETAAHVLFVDGVTDRLLSGSQVGRIEQRALRRARVVLCGQEVTQC